MIASAAAPILQTGMDLLMQDHNQQEQLQQQKALTAQQVRAQKELGQFNQDLALEMWEKTNYDAQVKQLEKAGLNVGLMYKGAGQGGTTQGGQASGAVAGGQATGAPPINAPQMGMALQLAMQQAQIENIKADTELKQTEATKKGGADTEQILATIDKLKQDTANAAIQGDILEYEKEIRRIESELKDQTYIDIIVGIRAANDKLISEAKSAAAQGQIDQNTVDEKIKLIEQSTVEQQLRIAGQKAGLEKTSMEIKEMAATITNMAATREIKWTEIDQAEKERFVREKLMKLTEKQTEFNTSTANQIKQWTSIITDIIKSLN